MSMIPRIFKIKPQYVKDHFVKQGLNLKEKKIVLLGAGKTGTKTLNILRSNAIEPVCFIDETRVGTKSKLKIYNIDEGIRLAGADCVVIVCIFSPNHSFVKTRKRINKKYNYITVVPFFTVQLIFNSERRFNHYFFSSPFNEIKKIKDYKKIYKKLSDSISREVLVQNLKLRILHKSFDFKKNHSNISFLQEKLLTPRLIYIDGGAFNGDTILRFIPFFNNKLKNIYAVEPDKQNYMNLKQFVRLFPEEIRRKIILLKKVLSDRSSKVSFMNNGNMSSRITSSSKQMVSSTTIDELIGNNCCPTFIKLDIEGSECKALLGSKVTLKRTNTMWGISVYHKHSDLIKIFNMLEKTSSNYQYSLRCHGGDGTDLVLYAY